MKIILDKLKIKDDILMQSMTIAHNPVQHDRMKHIEIGTHFINDNLDRCCGYNPCSYRTSNIKHFHQGASSIHTLGYCRQVGNGQYSLTNLRESVINRKLLGQNISNIFIVIRRKYV